MHHIGQPVKLLINYSAGMQYEQCKLDDVIMSCYCFQNDLRVENNSLTPPLYLTGWDKTWLRHIWMPPKKESSIFRTIWLNIWLFHTNRSLEMNHVCGICSLEYTWNNPVTSHNHIRILCESITVDITLWCHNW